MGVGAIVMKKFIFISLLGVFISGGVEGGILLGMIRLEQRAKKAKKRVGEADDLVKLMEKLEQRDKEEKKREEEVDDLVKLMEMVMHKRATNLQDTEKVKKRHQNDQRAFEELMALADLLWGPDDDSTEIQNNFADEEDLVDLYHSPIAKRKRETKNPLLNKRQTRNDLKQKKETHQIQIPENDDYVYCQWKKVPKPRLNKRKQALAPSKTVKKMKVKNPGETPKPEFLDPYAFLYKQNQLSDQEESIDNNN